MLTQEQQMLSERQQLGIWLMEQVTKVGDGGLGWLAERALEKLVKVCPSTEWRSEIARQLIKAERYAKTKEYCVARWMLAQAAGELVGYWCQRCKQTVGSRTVIKLKDGTYLNACFSCAVALAIDGQVAG